MLSIERLIPFVKYLGNDQVLVIGGIKKIMYLDQKLIRELEIIDTKNKRLYFPKSNYKLGYDQKLQRKDFRI